MVNDPYQNATLECDIVMKGGITSGVVYPAAVCELAREFRFRSVGGTSAGAIAAAATAAAEAGRAGGGFPRLQALSQWFGQQTGGSSNLQNLFQPAVQLKGMYRFFLKAVDKKPSTTLSTVGMLLSSFPLRTLAAVITGAVLAALSLWMVSGPARFLLAALIFLLPLLVAILSILQWLFQTVLKKIPANYFGLCTGATTETNAAKAQALTPWLSELLCDLAGKQKEDVLTFGDLSRQNITLQMLTTNLTLGRPYTLPLDTDIFYFKEEEMRDYFPANVVRYMVDHSASDEEDKKKFPGFLKLPPKDDFPVVVATRMSLSFPLLLSAVKLYAIDFGMENQKTHAPEACWFSDGGICSNLPVHFFDAPLPSRPTFAINLRSYHEKDFKHPIYMPNSNRGGIVAAWDRYPSPPTLGPFLNSILETMQNWRDNSQIRMPGYRDRTVHINLKSTEGGLNLSMGPETIQELVERGKAAGQELLRRFGAHVDPDVELNWENHRWVRFRSTMYSLEQLLYKLCERLDSQALVPTYKELIQDHPSYQFKSKAQEQFASGAVQELIDLLQKWKATDESFNDNAPSPKPSLRVVPEL